RPEAPARWRSADGGREPPREGSAPPFPTWGGPSSHRYWRRNIPAAPPPPIPPGNRRWSETFRSKPALQSPRTAYGAACEIALSAPDQSAWRCLDKSSEADPCP